MGGAFAAIALGLAPQNYADNPAVASERKLLAAYLRDKYKNQPVFNRVLVLWAAAKLPELLTADEKTSLEQELSGLQRDDGGWSIATFGPWKRQDNTALETASDGYSTGLALVALRQAGTPAQSALMQKGREWLLRNQNRIDGFWPSYSVNKKRDPKTDIGKFMTDAATAFAVMALTDPQLQ
jgi:squalene-hopene/tetraprenyl-beta-curcumene cyclase